MQAYIIRPVVDAWSEILTSNIRQPIGRHGLRSIHGRLIALRKTLNRNRESENDWIMQYAETMYSKDARGGAARS